MILSSATGERSDVKLGSDQTTFIWRVPTEKVTTSVPRPGTRRVAAPYLVKWSLAGPIGSMSYNLRPCTASATQQERTAA